MASPSSPLPDDHAPGDPPSGARTLMEVLAEAAERGFEGQLISRPEAMVECATCSQTFAAADLRVDRADRLEGASDAADLMIVISAKCPRCGRGGTLTLGYGPNASAEDAAVGADLDLSGR